MSNSDFLINKYGPLMTLRDLAEVLKRSVNGLRICLSYKTDFYQAISASRVYLGRRLYFSTAAVGEILDNSQGVETRSWE